MSEYNLLAEDAARVVAARPPQRSTKRLYKTLLGSVVALTGCTVVYLRNAQLAAGLWSQSATALESRPSMENVSGIMLLDEYNQAQCLRNTGGTCAIWGCHSDRGATDCVYWRPGTAHFGQRGHWCMCQPGYCAGLDGKCRQNTENTLVGKNVAIKSAQWPDQHMYVKGWSVFLDKDTPTDRGLWNVWQFPSLGSGRPSPNYIITNKMFADYALAITRGRLHLVGLEDGQRYYRGQISWLLKMDRAYVTIMNSIDSYTADTVTMKSMQFRESFITANQYSWAVTADRTSDPGPEGYWTFDPPLSSQPPQSFR